MAARPSYWTKMSWCLCLSMHITVTGIQNGEPVSLVKTLSACASAELEVALCELTYYHWWYNISSAHKNNKVVNEEHVTQIPDGYYNVCELNEDVFEPLGAELHLQTPTGRLQMSARKRLVLNRGLVKTPWVCSRRILSRQNIHCGRATQACYPSGDLRAPCWDKHYRQSTQGSPLYTA